MKGYISNKILYIFPQDAAEIPYVDPSVEQIAIQPEQVDAFKAVNKDYASKIVAYNYYTISVKPKVWNGHTNDDIVAPTPEPQDPELAWSDDAATVTIGADDNIFPTLTNPHSVAVSYSSSDETAATINASTGEITLVAAGSTTISAVWVGNDEYYAATETYDLTVEEAEAQDPELAWSAASATAQIGEINLFPTLTNPYDLAVSYSSSDSEKATIDASTGEITLVAAGSTTISAVWEGNDEYYAATETYDLTVEAAAPETYSLTVTDDLNAIDQIYDNNAQQDVDTEAVPAGDMIQVNLNEGFTVNKEATEGTIVTVTLNGVDFSDAHEADEYHYVIFEMQETNSSLVVEEYTPNQ